MDRFIELIVQNGAGEKVKVSINVSFIRSFESANTGGTVIDMGGDPVTFCEQYGEVKRLIAKEQKRSRCLPVITHDGDDD